MSLSDQLEEVLGSIGSAAIAVSGGVDSMTLACFAGRLSNDFHIFHAVSDAVPRKATERVKHYAAIEAWNLNLVNAGEFSDSRYRENPLNRCYFCKTNLYTEISRHTSLSILSGTNIDDLSDYRPGLNAAREFNVRHPFVEAGIDKDSLRRIARELGLHDLSELPAGPCLSSRVETGIRIESLDLNMIDSVESNLIERFGHVALRCRVRKSGLCIEIDHNVLSALDQDDLSQLIAEVQNIILPHSYEISVEPYLKGSAFVGDKKNG